jgi:RimJ/RimL family protein N-acetyltransferase
MELKFRTIKTRDGKPVLTLKIKNISVIDDKFLTKIIKPKLDELDKKGCLFFTEDEIKDEFLINSRINPREYRFRMNYSITKKQLKAEKTELPLGIKQMKFKIKKQYFNLLKKKLIEYHYTWKNFVDKKSNLEWIRNVHKLAKTRDYLCLKKSRKIITLIDLWEYIDFIRCPMDWIGHIWISPDLGKEERIIIHKYIRWWLKNNMKHKVIRAAVDSFNIRSQKFFRKMGFKPEWLAFLKSKSF